MTGYVPMCKKKYFIICCNSLDGLQSVELYRDKEEAENKLQEYYETEKLNPDNSEVHFSGKELHIITNEWQDDIWYEIVEKNIPIA